MSMTFKEFNDKYNILKYARVEMTVQLSSHPEELEKSGLELKETDYDSTQYLVVHKETRDIVFDYTTLDEGLFIEAIRERYNITGFDE